MLGQKDLAKHGNSDFGQRWLLLFAAERLEEKRFGFRRRHEGK